jgi:phosphomannomutase
MKGPHRFHPTVLREYDVRGIVGETLREADAYAVGRGFGTAVRGAGGAHVCLGYDGRLSSPDLAAAAAEGLRDCGLTVWRVGVGPSPMLYYAVHALDADGGLMVTGSHNPPSYNGFKMMLGKAGFYGEDIQKLGTVAAAGRWAEAARGGVEDRPVLESYVERLARDYHGPRDLTIAWDAGNGAAGPAMSRLTARLPGRHHLLFPEIDGRFPNHHPDPTVPENLVDLQRVVAEQGCDLGIAFDGDGDRIGVVDGQGRIVWGDQILLLLARDVLARHKGAPIIADVKSSQVLFDGVAAAGGRPVMWKTGHSIIKSKMAELKAPLAGEMSGHIFFADGFYGFDDALYVAVRLIDIVSRSGESLADMRDRLPAVVNTPELRFPCSEERKFAVVREVKERLAAEGAEVNDIDGVRVQTADGWWLLRASNTQDVLVARCEAPDVARLDRLKDAVIAQLERSGIAPPRF